MWQRFLNSRTQILVIFLKNFRYEEMNMWIRKARRKIKITTRFDTTVLLKFLRPTNALIYTYKMLKHTLKISRAASTCFGPFGPSSGSYRWTLPKLHICGDNQLNYVINVQQCCKKLFPAVVGTVCRSVCESSHLVQKPSTLDVLTGYFTPSHVWHQRLSLQLLSAPEDGRK
jgi:hypothetical protein